MKAKGVFQKIMDCFSRATLNPRSLLVNEYTNIVDQLHSLFVKQSKKKKFYCWTCQKDNPVGFRSPSGTAANKSKSYRYDLLTASNFGRVCSASFSNIVKAILYTRLTGLKEIEHGNTYEPNAIRALELSEGATVVYSFN